MSRLKEGEQESKGNFWTRRKRRQQLGTHSKAVVEQICTVDSAHSERLILARFSKNTYRWFAQKSRSGLHRNRGAVCYFFQHTNRGLYNAFIAVRTAHLMQDVQQHLKLKVGTKIEEAVQHLLLSCLL